MTVKLTVVYGTPDDATAWDQHYFDVHVPMTDRFPGLDRIEVSRVLGGPGGSPSPNHLIAELYFADAGALDAALASDAGGEAGKDFMSMAPPGSSMTVSEIVD